MDSNLFKTKSIEQLVGDVEHGSKALRRSLTAWDLTLLGIGAIIGTGIFVLTGTAAANQAGPAIMMSYFAAGLACTFAALCYAEFASMIPIAGSAYTYAYATLGEVVAWMIGWDLILEYAVGSMTVAIGWSGYMQRLIAGFGIELPTWMTTAPPVGVINLPATIIVLGIMVLLVVGRARIGPVQRGHGRHQGRGHPVLHRGGRHVREAGQLVAVHAVRLLGRDGRGRGRVLRLHRLRRGLDDGRGGEEPAARPPDRHHRLADHLHAAVSAGRRRPLRHRPGGAVSQCRGRAAWRAVGLADRGTGLPERAGGVCARASSTRTGRPDWSRPAPSPASPRCCS